MIFTDVRGNPVCTLAAGDNFRGERHLVIEQGDSLVSIPADSLTRLADLLCEVSEIWDGRADPILAGS